MDKKQHKHEHSHESHSHQKTNKKQDYVDYVVKDLKKFTSEIGVVVILASVLIGLLVGSFVFPQVPVVSDNNTDLGNNTAVTISSEELYSNLEAYLNDNSTALFMDQFEFTITDFNFVSGNIYAGLAVATKDGEEIGRVPVFGSLDGKHLLLGATAFDMSVPLELPEIPDVPVATEVPKSAVPEVELFVWAFCPGGVSGENTLSPVIDLIGDTVNSKVTFIGPVTENRAAAAASCFAGRDLDEQSAIDACCATYTINEKEVYSCALHNTAANHEESFESERQACIREKYTPSQYWAYLNEYNKTCLALGSTGGVNYTNCYNAAMQTAEIDSTVIANCVESHEAITYLTIDSDRSDLLDVHASPSLFINGVLFEGPRTPEGYKAGICDAYTTPPEGCGQEVGTATEGGDPNVTC